VAGTCIGVTRVLADGLNPFIAPSAGQVILVGQPFKILWSPGTPGPVFIALDANTNDGTGNITSQYQYPMLCSNFPSILELLVSD